MVDCIKPANAYGEDERICRIWDMERLISEKIISHHDIIFWTK